jgi:FkbM family methyltransferase
LPMQTMRTDSFGSEFCRTGKSLRAPAGASSLAPAGKIDTMQLSFLRAMVRGIMPLRVRNQVRVWLRRHPYELRARWPDLAMMDLPPRPVVVDVGAHVGHFSETVLALRPAATVFAFEPQPGAFAELRARLGTFDRVDLNACALGATSGTRAMFVSRYDQASSFLPNGEVLQRQVYGIDFSVEKTLDVQTRTLDEFAQAKGIERIDLLKLDVQGFELEVLRGALGTLPKVRWIYAEAQFQEMYKGGPDFSEIATFLRRANFDCVRMAEFRYDDDDRLMECDMVFRRREIGKPR